MPVTSYTPPVQKSKLNWPSTKETVNEEDTSKDALPVLTSLGIAHTEGGYKLFELKTQGDKVISVEHFQTDLRSNVMDQYKFRSNEIFEGNI